jgi:hypothetical protein
MRPSTQLMKNSALKAHNIELDNKGTGQDSFLPSVFVEIRSAATKEKQFLSRQKRKDLFGYCLL